MGSSPIICFLPLESKSSWTLDHPPTHSCAPTIWLIVDDHITSCHAPNHNGVRLVQSMNAALGVCKPWCMVGKNAVQMTHRDHQQLLDILLSSTHTEVGGKRSAHQRLSNAFSYFELPGTNQPFEADQRQQKSSPRTDHQ